MNFRIVTMMVIIKSTDIDLVKISEISWGSFMYGSAVFTPAKKNQNTIKEHNDFIAISSHSNFVRRARAAIYLIKIFFAIKPPIKKDTIIMDGVRNFSIITGF